MNDSTSTFIRRRTLALWSELLPDLPILREVRTENGQFEGFFVHGTDLCLGLFEGQWVLGHLHAPPHRLLPEHRKVTVNAGPFDFPEQAVAALFASVVHERALALLRSTALADDP